jgi:hypothetical protein
MHACFLLLVLAIPAAARATPRHAPVVAEATAADEPLRAHATAAPTSASEPVRIPAFATLELELTDVPRAALPFDTTVGSPFDDVLILDVTDPTGKTRRVEGFFDGDGAGGQNGRVWKVRLCPDLVGSWTWTTRPGAVGSARDSRAPGTTGSPDSVGAHALRGEFECVPSDDSGPLVARDRHFELANGGPIYLVGNFLDFVGGRRSTHTLLADEATDGEREEILFRQREIHHANFVNLYLANLGDYDAQSVTPWLGTAAENDKTRFDLARWALYDRWIERIGREGMLAFLWLFADDSGFGKLSRADRERYLRYALGRTSAYRHVVFIVALEFQEAFSIEEIRAMGTFVAAHNPWGRLVSTHMLEGKDWELDGEPWAEFIASQAGNDASPASVHAYARSMDRKETIPHLDVEFGILEKDGDLELRKRMWANLCGGAAGGGTGSDLGSLQSILERTRAPLSRMIAAPELVRGGGSWRFCRAEKGHHYLVYTMSGSPVVRVDGTGLRGIWFDPRDPDAPGSPPFPIGAGRAVLSPPDPTHDWVLWISDGSSLGTGVTRSSPLLQPVRAVGSATHRVAIVRFGLTQLASLVEQPPQIEVRISVLRVGGHRLEIRLTRLHR